MAGKLEKAVAAKAKELAEQFDGAFEDAADELVLNVAKKSQTAEQLREIHSDLIDQVAEQLHELLDAEDEDEEEDDNEEGEEEEEE